MQKNNLAIEELSMDDIQLLPVSKEDFKKNKLN